MCSYQICDDNQSEADTYIEERQETDIKAEPNDTYFQLSPQALTGQFSPKTLKFKGSIKGLPVMVLVDTRSTHNILQPCIANHFNLSTTPIPQFSVMVKMDHIYIVRVFAIMSKSLFKTNRFPFHFIFYLLRGQM